MESVEKKQRQEPRFLIYGGTTGWIGQRLVQECNRQGLTYFIGFARMENRTDVKLDLDIFKPTHVLLAAGITGRPTVDWCEDHKQDTIRTNVLGVLNVVDLCAQRGVHVTNFATGCIFEYDDTHRIGGTGFLETDKPNFHGSFYSHSKALVEDLLSNYNNCLTLRIRMPISAELTARNFVTKIINYAKVVDVPNSMTVLEDMLPLSLEAAQRNIVGILNFCNPGVISHNEILQLYKDKIDPRFTWTNFSVDECESILKCGRSNNALDTTKLQELFPNVLPIKEAVKKCFATMAMTVKTSDREELRTKGWLFPDK